MLKQALSCAYGPDYCAAGICVGNCNAQSNCDPGYGPERAKSPKSLLYVCCSKWGYHGTTPDFYADTKVKRPSCPAIGQVINHVVGYYED